MAGFQHNDIKQSKKLFSFIDSIAINIKRNKTITIIYQHNQLLSMFKIKPNKKSTTTLTSILNGLPQPTQKQRVSLQQNDDFLNVRPSQQFTTREQQDKPMQKNMKRAGSLIRPGSGLKRNLMRTSTLKNDSLVSNQQLIQQKIKQKTMQRLRPSTSSNNANENTIPLKQKKKHRLLNRIGTMNSNNNHSIKIPKPNRLLNNNSQFIHSQRNNMDTQRSDMYTSNEQVLEIMECILRSEQYMRLKEMNQEQFERIRQKLVSNVSIIALKWCKTIQDRLYNEVRSITPSPTIASHFIPQRVQQLIDSQIKRQFTKYSDLFKIEQQLNSRQSRLEELINGRLSKLQRLLEGKGAVGVVGG